MRPSDGHRDPATAQAPGTGRSLRSRSSAALRNDCDRGDRGLGDDALEIGRCDRLTGIGTPQLLRLQEQVALCEVDRQRRFEMTAIGAIAALAMTLSRSADATV